MQLSLLLFAIAAACAGAAPSPPSSNRALASLLAEPKFAPGRCYTGADTPEDRPALEAAVDRAISDVAALPAPVDRRAVHDRLERLIREVDGFATEDRDQAYRYAVRIWRAAGLHGESRLFALPDARVLAEPC